MLGSYSRNYEENKATENLDSWCSQPQQSSNVIKEFRSFLNTNSRENSEITIETARTISEEISNQVSRKLNEIKNSLNFQIQDAISNAITKKMLPSIQNTLETQGRVKCTTMDRGSIGLHNSPKAANFTTGDRRSSGLQRNSKVENAQNSWENRPRKCFIQENSRLMSRQSSRQTQNRDSKILGKSFKIFYTCFSLMFKMISQEISFDRKERKKYFCTI